MIDRNEMMERLSGYCLAAPAIVAAWFGGSDATDRTDALSDVDLVVVAQDDAIERILADVEVLLGPVRWRTRFAQPTFHGHEQIVVLPSDAPEHLLLDLVVAKESADRSTMFLEEERHGRPMVIRDEIGLTASPQPFDRLAHAKRMEARRVDLDARFRLFRTLVVRAIDRGHVAEASARYMTMLLFPFVERARMKHCPDRFDFGPRYLDRDLPADLRARIEAWSCWRDMDELRHHIDEIMGAFEALASPGSDAS